MPPAQRRSSPGAGLLASSRRAVEPPVDLPAFPDTPPPLPEGAVEGFADAPEGASEAMPITEALAPSGGPAVDPETGQEGATLGTTRGGRDPVLQAQLEAAEDQLANERRLADMRVAQGGLHTPVEVSPGNRPVSESPIEEHRAKQAAYREHRRMQQASTAELESQLAEPAADLEVESSAERYDRELRESEQRYQDRLEAMAASEVRYVATGRAPRPKVEGHTLSAGDVVPGAEYFARLQSWIDAGIIRKL